MSRPRRTRPPGRVKNPRMAETGYRLALNRQGKATLQAVYPAGWEAAKQVVRARANGQCEGCPMREGDRYPHRTRIDGEGKPVMMTQGPLQIAHLDHDPRHCDPARLAALCNRCHGKHDKRHHDGSGAVTGAVWGTLTKARLDLVKDRTREGAQMTGRLEPGEVELALAVTLAEHRALVEAWQMPGVMRFAGGVKVDPDVLEIAQKKLIMRGFARREGRTLVYVLNRPMWIEESEAI